jgi:hypothetical protein
MGASEEKTLHPPPNNVKARVRGDETNGATSADADISSGLYYSSQEPILRAMAFFLGLDMTEFSAILVDKYQIAQSRFPSESVGWQKWWAESLMWGIYCTLIYLSETFMKD